MLERLLTEDSLAMDTMKGEVGFRITEAIEVDATGVTTEDRNLPTNLNRNKLSLLVSHGFSCTPSSVGDLHTTQIKIRVTGAYLRSSMLGYWL